MAFATIADLEVRWRTLSDDEKRKAAVLLDDAAVYIKSCFDEAHKTLDPVALAENLKIVSCNIVKRAMSAPDGDYTQYQTTAGSFSEQFSFAAVDGNTYLKKEEKRMLGLLKDGRLQNVCVTGGESCSQSEVESHSKDTLSK